MSYSVSNTWMNENGGLVEWSWHENWITQRKTCTSVTLPTANLTCISLVLNLDFCGKMPVANCFSCWSQWLRGLMRRSAAACLLRSWVRIPLGAWMFVCCECCVLSGRGLCNELITRPEESYRLCCVVVFDLETSRMGAPYIYIYIYMTLVT